MSYVLMIAGTPHILESLHYSSPGSEIRNYRAWD